MTFHVYLGADVVKGLGEVAQRHPDTDLSIDQDGCGTYVSFRRDDLGLDVVTYFIDGGGRLLEENAEGEWVAA